MALLTRNHPYWDTINKVKYARLEQRVFLKNEKKWAVFLGEDGTVASISCKESESDEEYENSLKELKSLKNGNIITYDDV
jgi:hypothetical protein